MPLVTTWNAQFTLRSTHRVSQLLIGRGTISVPTMLAHAVSTSATPAAAATQRPASGTTMRFSSDDRGYAEPTEARAAAGPRGSRSCQAGTNVTAGGPGPTDAVVPRRSAAPAASAAGHERR